MAYVVTKNCYDCKYTDCVTVCPMDCFYEGEKMLYINPDECCDCDACAPECPVNAIFRSDDVPESLKEYVRLNAEMAQKCPPITRKKAPMEGTRCVGRVD